MSGNVGVTLMGGLGNQLFEIAAAYTHARRIGANLVLPGRTTCKRGTYWDSILKRAHKYVSSSPVHGPRYSEPHFHYAPIPAWARNIHGYFQSSKYFTGYEQEIRELFQIPVEIQEICTLKWSNVVNDNSALIHVRRTDYVNNVFHDVCSPAYYMRAISLMKERIPTLQLVVVSDDIEWCKRQPWLADATIVDETNDVVTLCLMSQFRHFIIANSSFSWWGVWLAGGGETVIAPNRWFGHTGPQDWQDIYEPSWIRLDTSP